MTLVPSSPFASLSSVLEGWQFTPPAQPDSTWSGSRPADRCAEVPLLRRAIRLVVIATILIAAPLSADTMFDTVDAQALFADVLRAGWYGLTDYERAAFIVQGDDGSLRCEMWPARHVHEAESFQGKVPPGTLAIVHTHPVGTPLPSKHDIEEAGRLQIPIYVLTIRDVYKVEPQSPSPDNLVHGRFWYKPVMRPDAHCGVL